MIMKKQFGTRLLNNNGRSPFWLKGGDQAPAHLEEKILALFQPDILVPVQYLATYRRQFNLDPEKMLMLAVLEDAVLCFQDHVAARCKRKKSLHLEAEEWILNEDKIYLFSFENICEMLGFDASYIRQGLMSWKTEALAPREDPDNKTDATLKDKGRPAAPASRRRATKAA